MRATIPSNAAPSKVSGTTQRFQRSVQDIQRFLDGVQEYRAQIPIPLDAGGRLPKGRTVAANPSLFKLLDPSLFKLLPKISEQQSDERRGAFLERFRALKATDRRRVLYLCEAMTKERLRDYKEWYITGFAPKSLLSHWSNLILQKKPSPEIIRRLYQGSDSNEDEMVRGEQALRDAKQVLAYAIMDLRETIRARKTQTRSQHPLHGGRAFLNRIGEHIHSAMSGDEVTVHDNQSVRQQYSVLAGSQPRLHSYPPRKLSCAIDRNIRSSGQVSTRRHPPFSRSRPRI